MFFRTRKRVAQLEATVDAIRATVNGVSEDVTTLSRDVEAIENEYVSEEQHDQDISELERRLDDGE